MRLLPPHILAVVCWQDGDGGEGVGGGVLVMVSGGDGPGPGVDGEHGGRAVAVTAGVRRVNFFIFGFLNKKQLLNVTFICI